MNDTTQPKTPLTSEQIAGLQPEIREAFGTMQHDIETLKKQRQVSRIAATIFAVVALLLLATSIFLLASKAMTENLAASPLPVNLMLPLIPSERFAQAKDYVVYYGTGRVGDLALYDVAIIQPNTLPDTELRLLANSGTVTLAYLSIGEFDPDQEWFNNRSVPQEWLLEENPIWGSFYVDVTQEGWRRLVVEQAGTYLVRGFNGFFLDTVDTIDLYPNARESMIEIIRALRDAYPNAVIVQNRGFNIIDDTALLINGVMTESLSSTYNFDMHAYNEVEESTRDALIEQLGALKEEYELVILALDYASPEDAALATYARQVAEINGFLSFVSEITLQSIPSIVPPASQTPAHTATAARTFTSSSTPFRTSIPTGTPTASRTFTASNTPTRTFTPAHTTTATRTFTSSSTPSRTSIPTGTPTASRTFTASNTPTRTFTPAHTATATATRTFTSSNIPSRTSMPTGTPTASRTFTPTRTITARNTPSPTSTPPP